MAAIVPMLDVMKIVMTKNVFRRFWWEHNISSYRKGLEKELMEAKKQNDKRKTTDVKRKIDACNKWLKRFSIDIQNLKDAQLEVVTDIIEKHHLRHKYQREIKRFEHRLEQVEKKGKKDPKIYDVKTLRNACEELLKKHVA